jgi:hypothetical protein
MMILSDKMMKGIVFCLKMKHMAPVVNTDVMSIIQAAETSEE